MEEDIVLVKKCLLKDNGAFERLIDKYQTPVYNLAMRMLGNSDDAEDLTQNVFVKAWESLKSYDSNYKFFSWLYRIAINESLNFLNREKKKERLENEELYKHYDSFEKTFDASERNGKIHKALTEIDFDYRTVIVLRHYLELSYGEIAELIDLPEKTVKSRLYSARQMLKEIFIKRGILNEA